MKERRAGVDDIVENFASEVVKLHVLPAENERPPVEEALRRELIAEGGHQGELVALETVESGRVKVSDEVETDPELAAPDLEQWSLVSRRKASGGG